MAQEGYEGGREVDYRGSRFALGRTQDAYAIWRIEGGPPVRTFPLTDESWPDAWLTFQAWDAGTASPTTGEQPPAAAGAGPSQAAGTWGQPGGGWPGAGGPPFPGGPVMDQPGWRFGLGRAEDRYWIWDLERRTAVDSFPMTDEGWREAWTRFQERDRPFAFVPTAQWRKGQPIPVRAMRAGQIVSGTFRLFFMNFWLLLGLTAATLLPVFAVIAVATVILLQTLPAQAEFATAGTVQAPFWLNLVGWLLGALAGSILTGALVTAVVVSITGRRPTFGMALREGFRLLGPILWVMFLLFLAILVLLIPTILLAVALALNPTSAVLAVLYILVLLATFVPIYFLVVRFLFAMSIVVVEGRRGPDALRRSWNLVQGLGWKVFGNFLLIGLVAAGIGFAVLLVGTVIVTIVTLAATGGAATGSGTLSPGAATGLFIGFFTLYALLVMFLAPFQLTGIVLQYLDARVRKEGLTEDALAGEFRPGAPAAPSPAAPPGFGPGR
jgi:hypothetical protein